MRVGWTTKAAVVMVAVVELDPEDSSPTVVAAHDVR